MQSVIARRHRPLAIFGDELITYHKGQICAINLQDKTKRDIYKLPKVGIKGYLSHLRLFERLFRIEIRASIRADEKHLIYVYNKRIYCLNIYSGINKEEMSLREGSSSPYYFCRIKDIEGFENGIVFGEYIQNNKRLESVGIYKRKETSGHWDRVGIFQPGEIRHIHGIVSAPDNNSVYILTGDKDDEAGIWRAQDNFNLIEPFLVGCQQFRTVHLFHTGRKMLYATDTPNEKNYIYSVETVDGKASLNIIQEINGSCIYASESRNNIFISSTVEPDERVRGWKSWINYKLGLGILNRYVFLYRVNKEDLQTVIVAKYKKDKFPYKLFQYGQCLSIFDEKNEVLLVYPIAVKKYDGKLIAIK